MEIRIEKQIQKEGAMRVKQIYSILLVVTVVLLINHTDVMPNPWMKVSLFSSTATS